LFALVILEIGSGELFVQASLEPKSSRSRPPNQLGLQAWATSTWLSHYSSRQVVTSCLQLKRRHSKRPNDVLDHTVNRR
jgi:hypothetical protein